MFQTPLHNHTYRKFSATPKQRDECCDDDECSDNRYLPTYTKTLKLVLHYWTDATKHTTETPK